MAHDECAYSNYEKLADMLDTDRFTWMDSTSGNDETPSIAVTFNSRNSRDYMDLQIFVPDCHDFKGYQVIDFHGSIQFENDSLTKLSLFLRDEQEIFHENF